MQDVAPKECVLTRRRAHILCTSALACVLASFSASVSQAQVLPAPVLPQGPPPPPAAPGAPPAAAAPTYLFTGSASASESYVSNSSGLATGSQDDLITSLGFNTTFHERTHRFLLDASYAFHADFYARGTQPTQITNNLTLLGAVEAIPEHMTITARAFASPVLLSRAGIVTAGNRVVSNGYSNSFGYNVEPDFRFRLGDYLNSETAGSYGQEFFSNPAGTTPILSIPGLTGPEDTVSRSASQIFSSGEYFDQLSWTVSGAFSELKRKQGLLSEKAGVGNVRYAFGHEFSLLGTVGYDAITSTVPLSRDVSGLVALGGFAVTMGTDFSLEFEGGQKFKSASYVGSLRYNLTPKSSIVGSLDDIVTTPEGQLLDSLTNLVSTPSGSLTDSSDLLGNGSPATLVGFNPQPSGIFGFDQTVSRYQTATLAYLQDIERNHAALSLYASRRTVLTGVFVGPPTTESWGGTLTLSRDISPLTTGTIGASYFIDDELGGQARTVSLDTSVTYALSRRMNVFFLADYLDRQSSPSLSALSPLTGSVSDYRVMIGISRTLWP